MLARRLACRIYGMFGRPIYRLARSVVRGRSTRARRQGLWWHLDLSENFDARLFFGLGYERETWRTLQRLIRPDMTGFDVGASMGAHALRIARALDADQGGRLIAFEPTEYAFRRLRRNAELNDLPALTLERIALADRTGEETIARRSGPSALSFRASWKFGGDPIDADFENIHFETLDSDVERVGMQQLHLLKIDVDGYSAGSSEERSNRFAATDLSS